MSYKLAYGTSSALEINIPDGRLIAACANGQGEPLADPTRATVIAVSKPLGFPALGRAVVPGDRVVIALDEGLPRAAATVAGIVQVLLAAQIEAESIHVLHANSLENEQFEAASAEYQQLAGVSTSVHDPDSETDLAYLAATNDGKPIYLNRRLCDADLVLPINLVRMNASLDYAGVHCGLFPAFSDAATQRRHRAPAIANHAALHRQRKSEVDEVAWLLGIQLTVQVIPGVGDHVLHVLAGLGEELAHEGQQLCAEAWSTRLPQRARLVLATIEGDPREQTWQNFGRALFAASQVCEEDGSIVMCTGLKQPAGPALQRLAKHGPSREVFGEIQRDRSPDAVSASLLVELSERHHIYLLSGLKEERVEGMQIGYIKSAEEIDRLMQRLESCVILSNAHRAVAAAP